MYDRLQKLYCTPTTVKLIDVLLITSINTHTHTHTHNAAVNTKNEM